MRLTRFDAACWVVGVGVGVVVMAAGCGRKGTKADAGAGGGDAMDPNVCTVVVDDTDPDGGVASDGGIGTDGGPIAAPAKPIDRNDDYPLRTEVQYLSGKGTDDAVNWRFMVTGGRQSCRWSTIPVPSQWEFHGFGTFHYGSEPRTRERGVYQRSFDVPAAWVDRRIWIVFEGAMTDTTVTVNGAVAGPTHQGAFYRFKYDITPLVHVGASNQIEVTVAKESSDPSVNEAERQADYWTFGGIFRPVYLEAFPAPSIERLAVDARADGNLSVDVFVRDLAEAGQLTAQVWDENLSPVGAALVTSVAAGSDQAKLSGVIPGVHPWNAETPHRYRLSVELAIGGQGRHAVRENFGFRTVEVRAGDGIYVNGTKVMLRGINRHCFWPESGRALDPRLSLADARLLKSLNVNAVRNAHYPADRHFLDAADALGLYVLDELAGWQAPPYATAVGRKLIEEMVTFNVNHPSIIFWDNGNEGGWNPALDGDFARWDPQGRRVLHPWSVWSGIDTDHYESYASTVAKLGGANIFLPTEFLHGLYDGGGGAGLEDYWNATRSSPRGAGGFLWVFADEGVLRADEGGRIDTKGNAAPDGIVGPYRQKEGSAYTIRQIWSPVRIALEKLPVGFSGAIPVENGYDFTDLATVTFVWRLATFDVRDPDGGHTVAAEGTARTGAVPPGGTGTLQLVLPANWATAHALLLDATDATGTLIGQWSFMVASPARLAAEIVGTTSAAPAAAVDSADRIAVTGGDSTYTFSKANGQLLGVSTNGGTFSLKNGPALSVGTATLRSLSAAQDGNDHVITATYAGDLQQVLWRVMGNGWLALTYRYALGGSYDYFGVDFDYPEANVLGVQWLGRGPHRVWKNRMRGPWHDVWKRDKNDAVTGQRWDYPEFKGYFADSYWTRLLTTEGPILIVVGSNDIFLRLFTPANGPNSQTTAMAFPAHDISFLHGISPIGDKFQAASATGPQGQKHLLPSSSTFEGALFLRFGEGFRLP